MKPHMSQAALSWGIFGLGAIGTLAMPATAVAAQESFLAKGAQAEAAIVIGPESEPFEVWVASEVQRYVRR